MNNSSLLSNATLPVPITSPYLFNRDPQMKGWEITLVVIFYGLVAMTIIIPNYLTLRALHTTKALLYRQKHLLGSMAMADFLVGFVSIPTFLYNMMKWPSLSYLIYEGVDSAASFVNIFSLAAISIQSFNEVVLSPGQATPPPSCCSKFLIVGSIWLVSGLCAGLNIVCLMDLFPSFLSYIYYFYAVIGFLCLSGFIILVTCFSVMATTCYKSNDEDPRKKSKEEANTFSSVFSVMLVYIILWMFPYIYFTYNRVCTLCSPALDAKFFYIIRVFMYIKCIFNPIIYFNKIMFFSGAIMRILTRECLGIPSR